MKARGQGTHSTIYRENCLQNGCAAPSSVSCYGCGFDREEHQRRRKLPLEQLPDGTYGIVLRPPEVETPGQDRVSSLLDTVMNFQKGRTNDEHKAG